MPAKHKGLSRKEKFAFNQQKVLGYVKKHSSLKGIDRRLSNWYHRQKKRKDVSLEEKERLEEIQSLLSITDNWEHNFEMYAAYHKATGRLVAPKENKKISNWVAEQRRNFKNGTLSESRKRRLLEVGFLFEKNKPYCFVEEYTDKQKKEWEEMYEALCRFANKHATCVVKQGDQDNPKLANWVSFQRKQHNKGKMSAVRKEKLDAIGFSWKINSQKSKAS